MRHENGNLEETMPFYEDHDMGDAQAPEGCPGPISPADQTIMCLLCGLAWWSDECDLFDATHPVPYRADVAIARRISDGREISLDATSAPGIERALASVVLTDEWKLIHA